MARRFPVLSWRDYGGSDARDEASVNAGAREANSVWLCVIAV